MLGRIFFPSRHWCCFCTFDYFLSTEQEELAEKNESTFHYRSRGAPAAVEDVRNVATGEDTFGNFSLSAHMAGHSRPPPTPVVSDEMCPLCCQRRHYCTHDTKTSHPSQMALGAGSAHVVLIVPACQLCSWPQNLHRLSPKILSS
jgi:hypothetical protein